MTINFSNYYMTETIVLFDTWGWTPSITYKYGEFNYMLNGMMPVGTEMNNNIGNMSNNNKIGIDAVVFMVDSKIMEDVETLIAMKPFYEEAKNSERIVIFAISKIDHLDGDLKFCDGQNEFQRKVSNNEVIKRIQKLIKENIDRSVKIIPIVNYEGNDYGNTSQSVICSTNRLISIILQSVKVPSTTQNEEWKGFDLFRGEEVVFFQKSSV